MIKSFDVKIPYHYGNDLQKAYRSALEDAKTDWVLLLDHDVFLCNPYWYLICLKALNSIEDKNVAFISCITNGTHPKNLTPQRADIIIESTNLRKHVEYSIEMYKRYGCEAYRTEHRKMTGFFMLLHREAALETGIKKIADERRESQGAGYLDWALGRNLMTAGKTIYILKGLYVYHMRGLSKKWGAFSPQIRTYNPNQEFHNDWR